RGRDLLERRLVDARDARAAHEGHLRHLEAVVDLVDRALGGGLHLRRRLARLLEADRERHAEARRVCRREELLRVRPGAVLEARTEVVGRAEAALGLEAPLARLERPFPLRLCFAN